MGVLQGREATVVTCSNWMRATGPQDLRLMEKAEGAREGNKMELSEPVLL